MGWSYGGYTMLLFRAGGGLLARGTPGEIAEYLRANHLNRPGALCGCGTLLAVQPSEAPTVEARPIPYDPALTAWERERVRLGTKPRNARKQATRLRTLFKERAWEEPRAVERASVVEALQSLRDEGRDVGTVETLLSTLKGFFDWAVSEGLANLNPCSGVARARKKGKGLNTRKGVRALYGDEPLRLLRFAPFAHRIVYTLALCSGGRKGQLTAEYGPDDSDPIRWRDVDLDGACLHFIDTKNGDNWPVPIPAVAVDALREWKAANPLAGPNDSVFPFKLQDRYVNADLTAASIPKRGGPTNRAANFSSLRKTYCTNLVLANVPVPVAQRLMQHKTVEMTLRVYAEVRRDQLEAGVACVQDFFNVGKPRPDGALARSESSENPPMSGISSRHGERMCDTSNVQTLTPSILGCSSAGGGTVPGSAQVLGGLRPRSNSPEIRPSSRVLNAEGRTRIAPQGGVGGSAGVGVPGGVGGERQGSEGSDGLPRVAAVPGDHGPLLGASGPREGLGLDRGRGAEQGEAGQGAPSVPLTADLLRAIIQQNARIVAWLTDHRLPLVVALATASAAAALWWAWPASDTLLAGPDGLVNP